MIENIEQHLREQGFYVSTTVGMSMWPMLKNRRDRIVIRPVGDRPLGRLDVPLYRRPDGKYVLHRILRVKEDHFVIRGDNTYALERVPKDWVIGYLAEFYRKGKHVKVDSRAYRCYAAVWQGIYPVRRVLVWMRRLAGKCKRALLPKK
ncbi:MAG: S24/S26 family peptidase [Clostridia bacterium]|nr:S24/S26 family peptidase [Clostridia bacterium]